MGLAILVLGLALFIVPHVLTSRRAARDALVAQLGEWPYKGLFSLVSLGGLVLIGLGFGHYRATAGSRSGIRRTGRATSTCR